MQRPTGKLHYAWLVLIATTLVVFGSLGLGRLAYSPILPEMQRDLGLTNAQAGALATSNFVGYLILALVGGMLVLRVGARTTISVATVIVGLSMILTGLVQNFVSALLLRALSGLGTGASNIPALGLLAAWFAPRRRGLAVGIAIAGSSLALIATGYALPLIFVSYDQRGWRVAWLLLGALVLILGVLAYRWLRNDPAELGLAPLGSATEHLAATTRTSTLNWRGVYRVPNIRRLALVYTAFGFAYIYITFFNKYLVSELGLSARTAGSLWSVVGWLSLLCGVIWGMVSDRWGRWMALGLVFTLHAVSFAIFALGTSTVAYLISASLFGISAWSVPAIMAAACGDEVGPDLAPAALGFVTLFFGLGQAAGPYIAGQLADHLGTLQPGLLLAAAAAAVGAFASLWQTWRLASQADREQTAPAPRS